MISERGEGNLADHPALSGVRKCTERRKSGFVPCISYGAGGIVNHEDFATLVLWAQILRV
ncbi:hypothetical protein AArcS_1281 [Natranaeroarchaeum sulfidigenes]|uniref:Uncharacterized protein n=1 Tax=Natranaeroarchaeum sulfidigenes TaxID=2784880 RepID=A0A897MR70_9EURY|nr:hypothetical protein AArcS_1281 [Natranaeroarchaeum sulfidigenes]